MTIDQDKQLSTAEYWDTRYAAAASDGDDEATHEWFQSFARLEPFFQKNLYSQRDASSEPPPLILHLGSGDSQVPAELARRGYRNQLCVDFSPAVVALMTDRHAAAIPSIRWRRADVRDMRDHLADRCVDVAFDKGTLDAMIYGSPWSPPDEVRSNTSRYLEEVHRVLKDDGFFLYITFRQPHFMAPLLHAAGLWDSDMQLLGDEGSFGYYGYVLTKKKQAATTS